MNESPDPLGKRALFWAPAERDEGGPRRAGERDVPGKHALFSPEARTAATKARPVVPIDSSPAHAPHGPRELRPGASRSGGGRTNADRSGAARGILSAITVDCSTCSARSEIHMTEFVMLHLPVWLWRPGRGYTRFMTCPACRRRTWVSASWAPWAR